MFDFFVNDEETNLLFEYHLINMQLFLEKKLYLRCLFTSGWKSTILCLSVVKKKIFSFIYLMYVVEWNMNIDILIVIYLYLFKNVIQVRNLTSTPYIKWKY